MADRTTIFLPFMFFTFAVPSFFRKDSNNIPCHKLDSTKNYPFLPCTCLCANLCRAASCNGQHSQNLPKMRHHVKRKTARFTQNGQLNANKCIFFPILFAFKFNSRIFVTEKYKPHWFYWETHQSKSENRDKLRFPMAGHNLRVLSSQWITKGTSTQIMSFGVSSHKHQCGFLFACPAGGQNNSFLYLHWAHPPLNLLVRTIWNSVLQ